MKYKLVVFDWDGTLSDSMEHILWSVEQACRDVGVPAPDREKLRWCVGLSLEEIWKRLYPELSLEEFNQFRVLLKPHFIHYDYYEQKEIILFKGVRELLQVLKDKGVLLAVATGKGYTGLKLAIEGAGLEGVFDATRTADRTAGKPDPLMLEEIMMALDVSPDEVVMVGDTTHDVYTAVNAKVDAVGVCYGGAHGEEELKKSPVKYIASTVLDLQTWLLEHV